MKNSLKLLAFALVAACASETNVALSDQEKQSVEKELKDATQSILTTVQVADVEDVLKLFSADSSFVYSIGDANFRYNDFIPMIRNFFPNVDRQQLVEITFEQYTPVSKDLGMVTWTGKTKTFLKSGIVNNVDKRVVTWLLRKENGEWKILNGHETLNGVSVDSSALAKQ